MTNEAAGPAPGTERRSQAAVVLTTMWGCLTLGSLVVLLASNSALYATAGFMAALVVTLPMLSRSYDLLSPWTLVAVVIYLGCGARGLFLSMGWEVSRRSLNELFFLNQPPSFFVRPYFWYLLALCLMAIAFHFTSERSIARGHAQRLSAARPPLRLRYTFHGHVPPVTAGLAVLGFVAFLQFIQSSGGFDLAAISTKRVELNASGTSGPLRALSGFGSAALWIYLGYAFRQGPVRAISMKGLYIAILFVNAILVPIFGSTRSDAVFIFMVAIAVVIAQSSSAHARSRFVQQAVVALLVIIATMTFLRAESRSLEASDRTGAITESVLEATVINRNLGDMQTVAHVMAAVPERLPYANGKTITAFLAAPIPRELWPDKPVIAPGPAIGLAVYGLHNSGVPPGLFAEMFWNFGYPGLLLGSALMGWVLGLLQRRFLPSARVDPAAALIYAAGPFRLGAYILSASVGTGLLNIAIDLVPLLIGILLCGRFARTHAHPATSRVREASPHSM